MNLGNGTKAMINGHGHIKLGTFIVPENITIYFYGPPGGAMSGGFADDSVEEVIDKKYYTRSANQTNFAPQTLGKRSDWQSGGIYDGRDQIDAKILNEGPTFNQDYPIQYVPGDECANHVAEWANTGLNGGLCGVFIKNVLVFPFTSGDPEVKLSDIAQLLNTYQEILHDYSPVCPPYDLHWLLCRSDSQIRSSAWKGEGLKGADKMWYAQYGGGKGTKVS